MLINPSAVLLTNDEWECKVVCVAVFIYVPRQKQDPIIIFFFFVCFTWPWFPLWAEQNLLGVCLHGQFTNVGLLAALSKMWCCRVKFLIALNSKSGWWFFSPLNCIRCSFYFYLPYLETWNGIGLGWNGTQFRVLCTAYCEWMVINTSSGDDKLWVLEICLCYMSKTLKYWFSELAI